MCVAYSKCECQTETACLVDLFTSKRSEKILYLLYGFESLLKAKVMLKFNRRIDIN